MTPLRGHNGLLGAMELSAGKEGNERTMGQTREKHRINSHLINHCPTSLGVSEVKERASKRAQQSARAKRVVQSKRMSERCERTSEVSGPVLQSGFLIILDHSGAVVLFFSAIIFASKMREYDQ